jgi:guanine deaminase
MTERLILGQVLRLDTDPAGTDPGDIGHEGRGALHLKDGLIAEVGPADALKAACPGLPVDDFGEHLIVPGFIDAHAHYPQTAIIASWGKRLIDWLNTYTFPEEMRFSDPAYAAGIAERYLDLLLANGTTTVCSYCTIHPQSVERSSPRPRRAECGCWPARPAWTATRARRAARHRARRL